MEFTKPTIEYADLWPLILVFGVACLGVVLEAFLPRERRYLAQTVLAGVGLLVAFGGTIYVATGLDKLGGGVARGAVDVEGTIVVDGPTVFFWGIITLFSLGGVLLFAERRLEGGVSAFAGQAAALPGTEAERQASTRGLEHTEVYPLMMFAVAGMMLFPAANDLLTLFVALEVLSLPLYLLCGLARRRRLLSQEAAMKYFLLGAFSSAFFIYGAALVYGFAGTMAYAGINEAVRDDLGNQTLLLIGIGMVSVGLLFKVGAAPFHAWTPDVYQGAPTPVTAFMAACTKIAAFGAILRLYYVAFGSERWTWQPMLWVIAILTMVVGAVLAVVQTDMKRMLAYSSIAHTGFLLTGVLGVQQASELSDGQVTSMQAVLFYLTTYGFAMIGAFAVVTLVRDSSGEASSFARWAGPGPPLAAGRRALRVLPALDGRHPADRRVRRQVGGLHGRPVRRCLARGDLGDPVQHRRGLLLRPRDRADVLRRGRPRRRGRERDPTVGADVGDDPGRGRRDPRPGRRSWPGAHLGGPCGTIRQVTTGSAGLALPVTDEALASRLNDRLALVEEALAGHVRSRAGFVTQTASHLMEAGGKRFRPLLVLLAAETGDRAGSDEVITAACVVELTHLASLYHDDVMDEADLRRGAVERPLHLGQPRRDPHRRLPLLEVLRADRRARSRRGPDPGADLHPAGRGPDPRDRRAPGRRGPARPLPRGRRGQDRLADRHLRALRRPLRRRQPARSRRRSRRTARSSARPSSSPTTSSTSPPTPTSPARRPGTDLREGVPTLPVLMAQASTDPADARLLELLAGDLTDDELHAEALDLLRKHPALDEARAYVIGQAQEAKAHLAAVPAGPVRDALEAFADIVATRSA